MIILSILTTLFLSGTVYFAYRAYVLAGLITDSEDYYDSVADTNQYMYKRIMQTYNTMKQIDRIGAFEKDDEAGTTFSLLKEVIDQLKEEFDAEEEEKK
tara:strand:- start:4463 stop:4759 length:297 start_codon:yes stop_codon:yes gene_type:complete